MCAQDFIQHLLLLLIFNLVSLYFMRKLFFCSDRQLVEMRLYTDTNIPDNKSLFSCFRPGLLYQRALVRFQNQ